jgi:hypothetical protein
MRFRLRRARRHPGTSSTNLISARAAGAIALAAFLLLTACVRYTLMDFQPFRYNHAIERLASCPWFALAFDCERRKC